VDRPLNQINNFTMITKYWIYTGDSVYFDLQGNISLVLSTQQRSKPELAHKEALALVHHKKLSGLQLLVTDDAVLLSIPRRGHVSPNPS
jgi:hypothetical protein